MFVFGILSIITTIIIVVVVIYFFTQQQHKTTDVIYTLLHNDDEFVPYSLLSCPPTDMSRQHTTQNYQW